MPLSNGAIIAYGSSTMCPFCGNMVTDKIIKTNDEFYLESICEFCGRNTDLSKQYDYFEDAESAMMDRTMMNIMFDFSLSFLKKSHRR